MVSPRTPIDALTLSFVAGSNVGSRPYLMEDDSTYQMFKLLNQEIYLRRGCFQAPGGLNGVLYFVATDADGGLSRYENNQGGPKYGTGCCDSQ